MLNALRTLYGDNEEKINEVLQQNSKEMISFKDGQIVYNNYSTNNKGTFLVNIGKEILNNIDSKVKSTLDPYTLEDLGKSLGSYYEFAFGRKNASQLAKAFQNDQEGMVTTVRSGVEYVGMGLMIGGMFFCPPAAYAGAILGSFGGIGVEALNESTRKNGLSEETKQQITKEILTNAALFATGSAATKTGSLVKSALLAEKCPTLFACIADIGIDSTISLLGDLALTGEINLEGEGLSQLLSLLAGHYRAGKFGKNKISLQDLDPSKNPVGNAALNRLKNSDPKLYEDYILLRNQNLLPKNFGTETSARSDGELSTSIKKDIALMADCIRKGINPKDAFIPKFKNLSEATKTKAQGEVFSLEGTNDVYVIDASGPIKLDMDRDMYYSLFPPIQKYCSTQGYLGDCYFVSAILDGSMNNPQAYSEMLQMFHQRGNDIIIELRGNTNNGKMVNIPLENLDNCPSQIVFKNAKKRLSRVSNGGIGGANGLKIIEEAYGYNLAARSIARYMQTSGMPSSEQKQIFEELSKIFEDNSYKPSSKFKKVLEGAFKTHQYFTDAFNNEIKTNIKAKILTAVDGIEALRSKKMGNGGDPSTTLSNFFGLSNNAVKKVKLENDNSFNTVIQLLEKYQNNPNIIIAACTKGEGTILQQLVILFGLNTSGKKQIVGCHEYRIDSYDLKSQTISIVNPWNTSEVINLTFDQFKKYFAEIQFANISQTVKANRSAVLIKKIKELGIQEQSNSGRYYTNEELVQQYTQKLEKEKGLDRPSYREITGDDMSFDSLNKNEAFSKFYQKLVEKYGEDNINVQTIKNAICQLNECVISDTSRINKLIDNMTKIIENTNIPTEIAFNLFNTIHSDYEFMLEKAITLFPKLKAKGYDNDTIIAIIKNISKENYSQMSIFWE